MLKENALPEISENDLAAVVESISGGELSGEWAIEPLASDHSTATLGIYRISGSALSRTQKSVDWSTVLKIVDPEKDSSGQREYLMANSAYLHSLRRGVRPAICYAATEHTCSERWIWMEDLSKAVQPPWSDSTFLDVARDVGKFNGQSSLTPPTEEWETTGIAAAMETLGIAQRIANFETTASDAFVSMMFGQSGTGAIQNVLSKYSQVVDGLAGITQIVAHGDMHAGNMFPIVSNGAHEETVAIDWAFGGMAALGEDAGNLIAAPFRRNAIDMARLDELGQQVFDQYLEALLTVNPGADLEDARTGFLAGFGYWALVKLMLLPTGLTQFSEPRKYLAKTFGGDPEDFVRRWGLLVDKTLPYAVECIERLGV
jgi:hypothetical protein